MAPDVDLNREKAYLLTPTILIIQGTFTAHLTARIWHLQHFVWDLQISKLNSVFAVSFPCTRSENWVRDVISLNQSKTKIVLIVFAISGQRRLSSHFERFQIIFFSVLDCVFTIWNKYSQCPVQKCVCSEMDHKRRQTMVRTLLTHTAIASFATIFFLTHFDFTCYLYY